MLRVHLFLMRIACLFLPSSFRQDYQREMVLVLKEELLGSRKGGTIVEGLRIWITLLPDLIETALRGHAELLGKDVRSWLRLIARRRAFAAGLIGNFAASIALAGAMFSVTHALLVRSLPYQDPERIVRLENFPTVLAQSNPRGVREWLKTQDVIQDIAYYSPWEGNLDGDDNSIRVKAASVSGSFFGVFGQSVLLGADFDENQGAFAVLSEQVWRDHFGSDPTIVGRTVRVNGEQLRVRGVTRRGFRFPDSTQFWTYTHGDEAFLRLLEERQAVFTFVVARLAEKATLSQGAAAAMSLSLALAGDEARNYPKAAVPLQAALTADIKQPLAFLTAAAGLLLLLGCASAAGLLIARNAQRREEIAVRFALGARPALIRRQAMSEGILFALSGGIAGVWATYLLVRAIPQTVLPSGLVDVPIDKSVLGVCFLTAIVSGTLTGWAAGWNASGVRWAQGGGLKMSTNSSGNRFGRWLLGGQIALTMALLAWAGLQGRSLYQLMRTDLGFDEQQLAATTVSFKGSPYQTPEVRRKVLEQWRSAIEAAIPGAQVAGISKLPLRRDSASLLPYEVEGSAGKVRARHRIISANYVSVAGGAIVSGRDFDSTDNWTSSPVALANEQFAAALGMKPGELVGRRLQESAGNGQKTNNRLIVGVYRREASVAPGIDSGPEISYPLSEKPPGFLSILVRVPGDPASIVPLLQQVLREQAPRAAVFDARTMAEYVAESLATHRLYALILGTFAVLSMVTSISGLVSLVLFYVSGRQRDLGIRVALGATPPGLALLAVRHGLPILVGGVAVGQAFALAGNRGIAALLVDVHPLDPAVHLSVSILLLLSGILAMLVCSLKVAQVDPSVTLRSA